MKKNIIVLKQAFRHSYSSEFGWKVDDEHPEDYMISYRVCIKEDCINSKYEYDRHFNSVHFEYHSNGGSNGEHYWISSFSNEMDEAFEKAGVEWGYYSLSKARELVSKALRCYVDIMRDKGYYKNIKITA